MLVLLSHGFAWKEALVNVTPKTFIGWHRAGFRLFWRWKSRPGRPRIPAELRTLIREMALSNVSWGEERITNELLLKLGIRVSLRRECLDFLIPLTENHLRIVTKDWVTHYNRVRPHVSLGPSIPDPPVDLPVTPHKNRSHIPGHLKVLAHPILDGLHHEYCLVAEAA